MAVTNQEFAEATGCDSTMASRLRNGHRLPGADLLHRIATEYEIPLELLHQKRDEGCEAMGAFLRDAIFEVNP